MAENLPRVLNFRLPPPTWHIVPNICNFSGGGFWGFMEDACFHEPFEVGNGAVAQFPMVGVPEHDGGNVQGKRVEERSSVVRRNTQLRLLHQVHDMSRAIFQGDIWKAIFPTVF